MANVTITSSNPSITVNKSNNTVNVSSTSSTVTVSQVAALANVESVRSVLSVTDAGGDGSLTYANTTGIFTYTGPSAAEVRAHLSNTSPIQYNSSTGVIGIDSAALFTGKTTDDLTEGTTNKYFTTTGATVNTDALPEGSTNLYYTNARADARVDAQTGANLDLSSKDTDDLAQGSTNLYFTNTNANTWFTTQTTDDLTQGSSNLYFSESLARSSVNATDAGGFGSFGYNSGTGVFTYTGPSSADIRGQLSATSPITYNSSTGAIGITDITGLNSSTDVDIKAGDSIYNFIDKNDNSTTEVFKIFANGETTGASDQLFQVDEQGNVTLWGNNADGNQARLRLRKDGDIILTQGNFGASTHLQLNAKLAPTPAGMVSGGTPRNGMWMRVASGTDPDSYTTKANSFIDFNQAPYSSSVTGGNWDGMILGHNGGLTVATDWEGANSETAGFTVRRVRGSNVSATSGSAENLFRVRANGVVDFGQITGQTPRARMNMTGAKSVLEVDQGAFEDITMSNTGISAVAQGEIQTGSLNTTRTNGATTDIEMLRAEASVQRAVIATTDPDKRNLISLDDNSGSQANAVTIQGKSNVNIIIDDDNAGTNQFTIFKTTEGSNSGNGILKLTATGSLTLNNAFTLPNTDGSVDQVLTTNGSGVVTWEDAGSGLTNAQVITHISQNPLTVGGNLNVQGNIIATGNIDYENVTDLYVTDQKITLNANAATDSNVQIIANRPQTTSTEIKWNEDTDKWTFTNDGSTFYNLATSTSDVAEGTNLYYTDARVDAHLSGGTGITYTAGSIDLDDTAVTPKTYGDAANVPQFTVDQQGRITGVSNVAITGTYANADVQNFLENGYSAANIDANDITAVTFTGDGSDLTSVRAETIEITIKNADTVTIPKGYPVHATGTSVGGEVEVVLADAGNSVLMPAHFIANEELTSTGDTGRGILSGLISGVDTSSFTVGDTIFVAVGGGYANVAPSGEANFIQNLGVVTDVAVSGKGEVYGAGRSAATPNLNNGNFFLGNGSNQAVTADFTDTANLAIADYDGDLSPANITFTGLLSNGNTGSESANILGNINLGFANPSASFGSVVHVGDTGNGGGEIGHYNPSFIGYGGKSLVIGDGALYVGTSLNFGRQFLNLSCGLDSTNSLGDGTIALSSLGSFRSNVQINMPVGNVDGTPNQVVGIKTNNLDGTRLGWYDPITRTTSGSGSANKEPVYDGSNNGWYAFGDLAKTTFDETFDANLTVSGNCFVTQATSLSSSLNVTGITTLSGNTFIDGITTISANVDLNANLDVSRNVVVDGSIRPRNTVLQQFNETKIDLGSQSGNIAALASFNAANGSIFTVTATGGIEISQIPNATTGSSYTIIVTQDGTGSHALTSTFKYQGGDKTLTTAAGNTDVISVVYDGSNYYATLSKDYY